MSVVKMNEENFRRSLKGEGPLLVEFWAPWCVYCRRLAPAVEELSRQYSGRLTVAEINVDSTAALADREGIDTLPTLSLYQSGAKLGSIVAPQSKADIENFLRGHGFG